MKTSKLTWMGAVVLCAIASACSNRDSGLRSGNGTAPPATTPPASGAGTIPDSSGATVDSYFALLRALPGDDEVSEASTTSATFTAAVDDAAEPIALP